MHKPEQTIFMNICMIEDDAGNVVVQERTSKKWPGISFPGGHVEPGESFVDSTVREIWEETGLKISQLKLCGMENWVEDGVRNVVFLYKTSTFEGEVTSSEEGKVWWMPLREVTNQELSGGMPGMLRLFSDETLSEQFYYDVNGKWMDVFK